MLRLLKELAIDMKQNRCMPTDNCKPKGNQHKPRKTPKDGSKFHKNISQYCQTHGACAHSSPDYPKPAKGHKVGATSQNKMDRSLARCE